MPGQRSYVKGFVLCGCHGHQMFKASEFKFEDTWSQEMRDQYAKLEKTIDEALEKNGACRIEIDGTVHHKVVGVIKWRYQQAGWIVERNARGGGSSGPPHDPYLEFIHPIDRR